MLGCAFGTSYSMPTINLMDWYNTGVLKKIIRILLALGLYLLIDQLFSVLYVKSSHDNTDFIFYMAFPQFLQGMLIFGPLVVLCEKFKLTGRIDLQ